MSMFKLKILLFMCVCVMCVCETETQRQRHRQRQRERDTHTQTETSNPSFPARVLTAQCRCNFTEGILLILSAALLPGRVTQAATCICRGDSSPAGGWVVTSECQASDHFGHVCAPVLVAAPLLAMSSVSYGLAAIVCSVSGLHCFQASGGFSTLHFEA